MPRAIERKAALIRGRWRNSDLYGHGGRGWFADGGQAWTEGERYIRQYEEGYQARDAAIAGQGL
ncbi:LysR family transcriptional regulator, partial [Pseudomonas aeruginosa]